MSIPPESIEAGKCYVIQSDRSKGREAVRRVVRIMPDGRIQFEHRGAREVNAGAWKSGMQEARSFASMVQREVSCDWTPEADR